MNKEFPDYVMHKKTGRIGYCNLPDWLDFDEQPPRSFDVVWVDNAWTGAVSRTTTEVTVKVTKEVADLIRSLNNGI